MKTVILFKLDNPGISKILDLLRDEMGNSTLSHKDILRMSLMVEESLLNLQGHFGVAKEARFTVISRFGTHAVTISVEGESYDPLAGDSEGQSHMIISMLSDMGLMLSWKYRDGHNQIGFSFREKRKQINPVITLLIAIVLSVVCGFGCRLLPENVFSFIINEVSVPVFDKFIGVLSAISGPLIFLSVMWGIFSIGDTASLSRIGKTMFGHFFVMHLMMSAVVLLLNLPFYHISATGDSGLVFSDLFSMLLDIIPENVVLPFSENNPLQIIFIATVVGVAALVLIDKSNIFVTFVEQSNYIVQFIMAVLTKLIPVFIFLSLFNLVATGSISTLQNTWKPVLLFLLVAVLLLLLYTLFICLRKKVSPIPYWKKLMQAFFIAVTTASSAATFSTVVDTCTKEFGADERLVSIGIPLGQVLFKVGTTAFYICTSLFMAEMYQVSVSPSRAILLVIVSIVLSVATPSVPGGALVAYSALFKQLGIPMEGLTIVITLDSIMGFLIAPVNVTALQMEMTEIAGVLDLLNIGLLRKPKDT